MSFTVSAKRIFVAGHRGMVGSALVRRLGNENCDILSACRDELDLTDAAAVRGWLAKERPDAVIVAAAKVGGIHANDSYPAEFLHQNMMIAANVIDGAHRADIDRLLFLGSSCIYPKFADQPIVEDALLTGALEETNIWYAVAKIAGIKYCDAYRAQYGRDYISAMPTNLYGPGDNYHPENSHVLPALIRRAHEAKLSGADSLSIWGSGTPRREFLHADDCADACVFLLQEFSGAGPVNVGYGSDLSIYELAQMVCGIVGFSGTILVDPSKPDGTPRKLMSSAKINAMGWQAKIALENGIASTYQDFLARYEGIDQ